MRALYGDYRDGNNVVANRFGASVTPEAFVLDSMDNIRYHAGTPVPAAGTKAFGCTIKKVRKTS